MRNADVKREVVTAKAREEAFRRELKELLYKHSATMDITGDGEGWMSRHVLMISMGSEWTPEGDKISEYAEFKL